MHLVPGTDEKVYLLADYVVQKGRRLMRGPKHHLDDFRMRVAGIDLDFETRVRIIGSNIDVIHTLSSPKWRVMWLPDKTNKQMTLLEDNAAFDRDMTYILLSGEIHEE